MLLFVISLLVTLLGSYYIIFVKGRKVTNYHFIKFINSGDSALIIQTMESFKYISSVRKKIINDSSVELNIYATTAYNIFAKKNFQIKIPLQKKIKYLVFGDEIINRYFLP